MSKELKKTLFVLNVDNYAPELCEFTYPFLKLYAERMGADFYEIKERKYPDMPPVYEKLQIYDLGREMGNDWNIYIDSDALIHPESIDYTNYITKDTVVHNGTDFANIRWKYDKYFLRHGKNTGSCNWFTIASDWCLDLWHPLDIPFEEALSNIYPIVLEKLTVIKQSHLIDDYTLSRNIAKYGLKVKRALDINTELGIGSSDFFFHGYLDPIERKLIDITFAIKRWHYYNTSDWLMRSRYFTESQKSEFMVGFAKEWEKLTPDQMRKEALHLMPELLRR